MSEIKIRKLQGKVLSIKKTGEKKRDESGRIWEKCVFTVELTGFSKRTPNEAIPPELRGKKVKIVRWCCFDWHYKLGVRKTLEQDETEAFIEEKESHQLRSIGDEDEEERNFE
jgi:hypothetical protein